MHVLSFVTVSLIATFASAAAIVDYDFRQNVNLLNADNVLISATSTTGTVAASRLRGNLDENNAAAWNGGTTSGNAITIDFQTVRNVKTIRMNAQQTGNGIGGAIVEKSSDGISWSPVSGTFSTPAASGTSNETNFVLNSAADTRYMRVTRNDAGGTPWRLNDLRVYGDTGALAGDRHLDVVARSAYNPPNVTWARSGFSGEDGINATGLVDDSPSSISRQIWYSFGQGNKSTWVELDLGRLVELRSLGINFAAGYINNSNSLNFEVHGSTSPNSSGDVTSAPNTDASNNFAGSTLLLDHATGSVVEGLNYFDLNYFVGRYVRIDFFEPTDSLRFSDLMVYQYVPEPTSLLGAAIVPFLIGRRRRA